MVSAILRPASLSHVVTCPNPALLFTGKILVCPPICNWHHINFTFGWFIQYLYLTQCLTLPHSGMLLAPWGSSLQGLADVCRWILSPQLGLSGYWILAMTPQFCRSPCPVFLVWAKSLIFPYPGKVTSDHRISLPLRSEPGKMKAVSMQLQMPVSITLSSYRVCKAS